MKFPDAPQAGRPVKAAWALRLLQFLRSLVPQNSATVRIERGPTGWRAHVRQRGQSPSPTFPLQPVIGSEPDKLRFRYGTVAGTTPKIGEDVLTADLSESPELTITESGKVYVKVDLVGGPYSYYLENPVIEFAAEVPDDVLRESAHVEIVDVVWDDDANIIKSFAPAHKGSIDGETCGGVFTFWDLG